MLLVAAPAHAASNGIPSTFRGTWDVDGPSCKGHGTDGRLRIGAQEIREYEGICELKMVAHATQTSFKGSFICSGEGDTDQRQISLELRKGMLINTIQNTTLVRCK